MGVVRDIYLLRMPEMTSQKRPKKPYIISGNAVGGKGIIISSCEDKTIRIEPSYLLSDHTTIKFSHTADSFQHK